jgi:hypothetical protein
MAASDQTVNIQLTRAEALVLFEWLARTTDAGAVPVDDPAEELVLWRIEGQLESTLAEPFAPNYKAVVEAAREEVRLSRQ